VRTHRHMGIARVRTLLVPATTSRYDPDRDDSNRDERNRCKHTAHPASISPVDPRCKWIKHCPVTPFVSATLGLAVSAKDNGCRTHGLLDASILKSRHGNHPSRWVLAPRRGGARAGGGVGGGRGFGRYVGWLSRTPLTAGSAASLRRSLRPVRPGGRTRWRRTAGSRPRSPAGRRGRRDPGSGRRPSRGRVRRSRSHTPPSSPSSGSIACLI
jgi:hypothetical protein